MRLTGYRLAGLSRPASPIEYKAIPTKEQNVKRFKRAKDIKVGVIGYSGVFGMGSVHLQEMQAAGMTPTAVCEVDEKRLKVAAEEWPGLEMYPSIGQMLRKSAVDLVAVITPHSMHARHVLQCLRAGRSVCCEKPLAITTAECDRMVAAAKAKGYGHKFRYISNAYGPAYAAQWVAGYNLGVDGFAIWDLDAYQDSSTL